MTDPRMRDKRHHVRAGSVAAAAASVTAEGEGDLSAGHKYSSQCLVTSVLGYKCRQARRVTSRRSSMRFRSPTELDFINMTYQAPDANEEKEIERIKKTRKKERLAGVTLYIDVRISYVFTRCKFDFLNTTTRLGCLVTNPSADLLSCPKIKGVRASFQTSTFSRSQRCNQYSLRVSLTDMGLI